MFNRLFNRELLGRCIQFGDAQRAATVAFDQAHGARVEGLIEQFAQGPNALRAGIHLLACRHLVKHVDQGFVRPFNLMKEALADRQAAFFNRAIQVQQCLTQLIHLRQIGHVRPMTQGGQLVEQSA